MLPYRVYLDRHDAAEHSPVASACKAAFDSYHDAEQYAKQLAAAWLDRDVPVLVRIAGPGGNLRLFPLRTTAEEYGPTVARLQPAGIIDAGAEEVLERVE